MTRKTPSGKRPRRPQRAPEVPSIEKRIWAAFPSSACFEEVELRNDLLDMAAQLRSAAGVARCAGFEMQVMACQDLQRFKQKVMGRAPRDRRLWGQA